MIWVPPVAAARKPINVIKNILHGTNYFGSGTSPFMVGPTQRIVRALNVELSSKVPETVLAMARVVPNPLLAASVKVANSPIGVS
eukprot:685770-Rhodomonas_salina.1